MESTQVFTCECGKHRIELTFRHNMPTEVVDRVYCPDCISKTTRHDELWPIPGNWSLHFNKDVAKLFMMARLKIDPELANSGFIIDRGFVE